MNNKSKQRAWEILTLYLDRVKSLPFVSSVILVGSLSDDTYTGNAGSDIDLVHIVDDGDDAEQRKAVWALIDAVEGETDHDIPISRVVYQARQLRRPYSWDFEATKENKDLIERPIEVLRILDTGKTVYGRDYLPLLEKPSREDVRKSNEFSKELEAYFKQADPAGYEAYRSMKRDPTIRILTQIVLTTAMADYYDRTEKNCSSKNRILACMEQDIPELPYLELLRLCHRNRFHPETITEADQVKMARLYQTTFLK